MSDILKNKKTIAIPKDKITLSKELALIFKKLELGQTVSHISEKFDESCIYNFEESDVKRFCSSFLTLNSFSTNFDMRIDPKRDDTNPISIKIDIPMTLDIQEEDLSKFYPYLNFLKNKNIKTTFKMKKKMNFNEIVKSSNDVIKKVSMLEKYKKELMAIIAISKFNYDKYVHDISLNSFVRILKVLNEENEIELPLNESLRKVINVLKFYKKMDIYDNFSCGSVNVSKLQTSNIDNIIISYANLKFVDEATINKFNYIFHPGLNLITKYLELTGSLERFDLSCQKKLYKRV